MARKYARPECKEDNHVILCQDNGFWYCLLCLRPMNDG
jgi:hypothetical protein